MRSGRCRKSYQVFATMSKPFSQTRREVTPMTGRSGNSGSPSVRRRSALQAAFPARSFGEKRAATWVSTRGSHSS